MGRELKRVPLDFDYGYNSSGDANIIMKLIQDIKELKQKVPPKLGLIEISEDEVWRQTKERFIKELKERFDKK